MACIAFVQWKSAALTNIFQRRQKLFKMCESLILQLHSEEMYQYETCAKL